MPASATGQVLEGRWRWAAAAGCFTLALAVVAFFLPGISDVPRGAVVGWLLVLSGIAEIGFGAAGPRGRSAVTAVVAGVLTTLAGLIFVARPFAPYFSVANIVTLWLALRGLWVVATSWSAHARGVWTWLAFSGLVDLILAFVLLSGIHISLLVVTLFGPTPEVIARFSLVLMASFFATGASQLATAMDAHREPRTRRVV